MEPKFCDKAKIGSFQRHLPGAYPGSFQPLVAIQPTGEGGSTTTSDPDPVSFLGSHSAAGLGHRQLAGDRI